MPAYRCSTCGSGYDLEEWVWACRCGGLLDLDGFVADPTPSPLPWSMWRYRRALPVTEGWAALTMGEGMTPLVPAGPGGWYKADGLMPTGSYKDRGAISLLLGALHAGATRIVADSSGNAGLSIATYAGRAGLAATVYVPEGTKAVKLARLRATGAAVRVVPGGRGAAADAARDAADAGEGWYASHVHNPLFVHGTKTFALEVWEQLGGRSPGTVVVPAGNGTLLLGAAIGFADLVAAGRADHLPRLVAVQGAACAPLAAAWGGRRTAAPPPGIPVAEGIAIPYPPRLPQMIGALLRSGGRVLTVDDAEILAAQSRLAAEGIVVEPTAAAAPAAWLRPADREAMPTPVVVALTGRNGAEPVSG